MTSTKRQDSTILNAVDEGLTGLGENVRDTIYYHVETKFQVRREEIPERLEAFHQALEGLLGEGAKTVEKMIARSLFKRLGLNFEEHDDWTLINYVDYAKKAGRHGR